MSAMFSIVITLSLVCGLLAFVGGMLEYKVNGRRLSTILLYKLYGEEDES